MNPVAVVDLGSNTLKVLVARTGPDGSPELVAERVLEVRLGGADPLPDGTPRLGPERIAAGAKACAELVGLARSHGARSIAVVATAAVRAAADRAAFAAAIQAATGLPLRVLPGEEEARLVGRGLRTDPALAGVPRLVQGDLGGGSLELVEHGPSGLLQAISLPLGAVRTTRDHVADPRAPWPPAALAALAAHVRASLRVASFGFDPHLPLVVTGGGATLAANLLGAGTAPARADLERLAGRFAAMPAEERVRRGISPGRADIAPAAFMTLAALAEVAGVDTLRVSTRNLRWGLAAEALETPGDRV